MERGETKKKKQLEKSREKKSDRTGCSLYTATDLPAFPAVQHDRRVDREFTFFYVLNISVVALSLVAGWS